MTPNSRSPALSLVRASGLFPPSVSALLSFSETGWFRVPMLNRRRRVEIRGATHLPAAFRLRVSSAAGFPIQDNPICRPFVVASIRRLHDGETNELVFRLSAGVAGGANNMRPDSHNF